AGLGDAGSERVHGDVADHRTEARIIVPALLISRHEGRVRWCLNLLPRIAGDDPSDRGLVLERIEIFRLAREQADDSAVLEGAAGRALTNELGEVTSKQHVENGVGLAAPASTLPSGGACSVTNSTSGCAFLSISLNQVAADWPYSKLG